MTDKTVTYEDLKILRGMRRDYDGGDNPTVVDEAHAALLDRLIAAAEADRPPLLWEYRLADSPKMLRETLCVAQAAISSAHLTELYARPHIDRLGRLIDECDRHRPIDNGGKHGDLHTATCGCEGHLPDRLTPLRPTVTEADVERAAQALYVLQRGEWVSGKGITPGGTPWGTSTEAAEHDRFLTLARAAFEAAEIEVRDA